MAEDYEKLGSFYLGKVYDLAKKKRRDEKVLYDSKDLVTHAVCVGMTGSGKTGLCLTMLEEAAIDGIPAIVIDPKGDLSNLLLTFPSLRAEDFRPWINEDDARKKGVSPDDFAKQQADMWRKGLADWEQDGQRIQRLRDAADVVVFTPGSNAGLPVSILKSFSAPAQDVLDDSELMRERVASTATSLLGLMGISADPVQSREHILLSAIFATAWAAGNDLDLAALIQQIQQPPMTRLGVMDLESVYPAKERFGLAMSLNNLIAAPGFASWMEGEPLDIEAMLHTSTGKPRISIFSIAHLSDAERMFFVSLLLNQTLGWVRTQSGTSSLRAIVYMDEIAGYFPPVANPPSKQPLLMLMKQARAFGVGIVLATQNPVDLDYKGLANAGTWFIGRLQTERDKARVLDGLEGAASQASARFDRASVDAMISQLGNRVFLMNNVHEDSPEIIETRWALSYLRGPLTRTQLKQLMDPVRRAAGRSTPASMNPATKSELAASDAALTIAPKGPTRSQNAAGGRVVLPPDIPQYFIPARSSTPGEPVLYKPMLLGCSKIFYSDIKAGIDQEQLTSLLAPIGTGPVAVEWDRAESIDLAESDVEREPVTNARFDELPPEAGKAKSYDEWKRTFADSLFRTQKLEVLRSPEFEINSTPGERERDFRVRLAQLAREQRDASSEKLRQKYAPKILALQERVRRAEAAVEAQKSQATSAKLSTAISFGAAILGAFMGRKMVSATSISKAATAAKGIGRTMKESGDVSRAEDSVGSLQQQIADLNAQFTSEVEALSSKYDATTEPLDKAVVKPKKNGISVKAVMLGWAPFSGDGQTRLWE